MWKSRVYLTYLITLLAASISFEHGFAQVPVENAEYVHAIASQRNTTVAD